MASVNTQQKVSKNLSFKKLVLIIIAVAILLTAAIEVAAATKYKMQIEVISQQDTFFISPVRSALDFGGLPAGSAETRSISLENKGDRPTFISVVVFGEIANWIKLDKNNFSLPGGANETINFRLFIPPLAEIGTYAGDLYILRLP